MIVRGSKGGALLLLAALACLAAGCRTEEQGRKLGFDKGHYGGKADTQRDSRTQTALADRVKTQKENF
jgi:hypothetical protein